MKLLFSSLALASSLTFVQAQNFIANLDGAQDGTASAGHGTVSITLSGTTLTFTGGTWSGLGSASTSAHIHGPAAPGTPAGVLYPLHTGATPIIPVGGTSGTISGTLNLTAGTGGFTVAQQLDQLNSGQWYLNIHSVNNPGGEIRGQILLVPEPATWTLGGLGLLSLLAWRRWKLGK